jgi:1,4-dihydroxy-2-naphthoyl-CoA hydrolase
LSRNELESLLSKDHVTKDLGVVFVELDPERMVATMPVDGRHLQPFGYLHGGVSVVLAKGRSARRSTPATSGPSAPGAL